jgi:predicted aconitase
MATGETNRNKTAAFGAAMALATAIALAGCSVQRPGAAQDHSLDSVERNRAAMGVALADTSYDKVESNRLTFGSPPDTSYDDVERLRAGRTGH